MHEALVPKTSVAAISPYSHKDNPTNKHNFHLLLAQTPQVGPPEPHHFLYTPANWSPRFQLMSFIRLFRYSTSKSFTLQTRHWEVLPFSRRYNNLFNNIVYVHNIVAKHICQYVWRHGKGYISFQPQKRLLLYPKGRREATGGEQGLRSPDCDVTGHCFTIKLVHQDYCFLFVSQPFVRILYHNFC